MRKKKLLATTCILVCSLLMASCINNPFGKKSEGDQDSTALEAPHVDMAKTATPQSSPDKEKKPSIAREKTSFDGWENITLKGYSEFSDKKFPIKVKAKVRHTGRWPKYKDGVYHNINYNATFPVDITVENGTLYIKRSGKEEDMTMIMYKVDDSPEWRGSMITKSHIMDCYLEEY